MKKMFVLGLIAASALFGALQAQAITIDGNLNDWGVTPFTDWAPSSATADYTVENNTNRQPESDPFAEIYDLEAMYFDDDADYLYFGIVTSNDYSNAQWASEDLGINVDADAFPEYAADIAGAAGQPQLPLNQLAIRNVYQVNTWNYMRGVPYSALSKTTIGTYEIYNRNLGAIEGAGKGNTYVLEGRISRLLLGNLACGVPIEILFSRVTCLKDWINVRGDCDGLCPGPVDVIPEPATMLLLGSGLLGLAGLKRRKK